ncbi:MAG: hypothetical protein II360_02635 [Muribaculaceae bacterium]|mgnify:CR=1 FL=1|nr:hypothetical protein [Muribaculaceae bacterium]
MKKILTSLLLGLVAYMTISAAETDLHDNRLYIAVGKSDDLSQVPIDLHLENPTINITAIELYLTLPEGVYVGSVKPTSRSAANHVITAGDTPNGYFVSIASEKIKSFENTDGAVCTFYCDFSPLVDGDYTISTSGVFAIGVADDIVTCYTTDGQEEQFTKNEGLITEIDKIEPNTGSLVIYNLQGFRLKEPQNGQINIINGKKVIL